MVRPFPTQLVDSVTRAVLLAPCLLICSACVTPFPLDNLEVNMTMAQATEAFGEPSSTNMGELRQAVELLQKESARIFELLESAVDQSETRGPAARKLEESSTQALGSLEGLVAELDEAPGGQGVVSTWVYPHEEVAWGRAVAGGSSARARWSCGSRRGGRRPSAAAGRWTRGAASTSSWSRACTGTQWSKPSRLTPRCGPSSGPPRS